MCPRGKYAARARRSGTAVHVFTRHLDAEGELAGASHAAPPAAPEAPRRPWEAHTIWKTTARPGANMPPAMLPATVPATVPPPAHEAGVGHEGHAIVEGPLLAERLRRPRGADRAAQSTNPFLTTLVTCWAGGIEQTFLPVAQHPPARARAIVKVPLEEGAAAVIISKCNTPLAADSARCRGNRRALGSYRRVRGSMSELENFSLQACQGCATVW